MSGTQTAATNIVIAQPALASARGVKARPKRLPAREIIPTQISPEKTEANATPAILDAICAFGDARVRGCATV